MLVMLWSVLFQLSSRHGFHYIFICCRHQDTICLQALLLCVTHRVSNRRRHASIFNTQLCIHLWFFFFLTRMLRQLLLFSFRRTAAHAYWTEFSVVIYGTFFLSVVSVFLFLFFYPWCSELRFLSCQELLISHYWCCTLTLKSLVLMFYGSHWQVWTRSHFGDWNKHFMWNFVRQNFVCVWESRSKYVCVCVCIDI